MVTPPSTVDAGTEPTSAPMRVGLGTSPCERMMVLAAAGMVGGKDATMHRDERVLPDHDAAVAVDCGVRPEVDIDPGFDPAAVGMKEHAAIEVGAITKDDCAAPRRERARARRHNLARSKPGHRWRPR